MMKCMQTGTCNTVFDVPHTKRHNPILEGDCSFDCVAGSSLLVVVVVAKEFLYNRKRSCHVVPVV
jgi:hypothetical protein